MSPSCPKVNFRLAVVCALVKGSSWGVGGRWWCRVFEAWRAGGVLGWEANCRIRGWGFARWAVLRISFYFSSHPVLHNENASTLQPFSIYVVHLKIIRAMGSIRPLSWGSPSTAQSGLSVMLPKLSELEDYFKKKFQSLVDRHLCKILEIQNYSNNEKQRHTKYKPNFFLLDLTTQITLLFCYTSFEIIPLSFCSHLIGDREQFEWHCPMHVSRSFCRLPFGPTVSIILLGERFSSNRESCPGFQPWKP